MANRFYYFDSNGLGEGIRYLLHYVGAEFEDVRYDDDSWPGVKGDFPFGVLPVYEEAGRRLSQSLAIARYLGHTNNLLAGDAWRDAQLDATAHTIYDFVKKLVEFELAPEAAQRAVLKKAILTESVDFYFSRFETQLKENEGYFSGKLSWVDFVFVGIIETANMLIRTSVEAKYPSVQALVARIHSYPGVEKYVATRKPYTSWLDD